MVAGRGLAGRRGRRGAGGGGRAGAGAGAAAGVGAQQRRLEQPRAEQVEDAVAARPMRRRRRRVRRRRRRRRRVGCRPEPQRPIRGQNNNSRASRLAKTMDQKKFENVRFRRL